MKKTEIFEKELMLIREPIYRHFVEDVIEFVPSYFFEIPASSSGKYHPWYALGYGGLLRHTKAAVKLAEDLLNLEQNKGLSNQYHDHIIAALILHDCWKQGVNRSGHTENLHPTIAANMVSSMLDNPNYSICNSRDDSKMGLIGFASKVATLIESHMGEWNADGQLPKPFTPEAEFVHMCDYLASRKYLIVEVE